MEFTHLHVHTEYSLLDGAAPVKRLVARAKELGMSHLAMTDHGVMYGAVEFYKECKKQGITPILGCEVYVAKNILSREDERPDREYSHLILLAKNQTGYQNLIKLVSFGFLQGFYYKPRIDYEILEQHAEGLICSSACLAGDIPRLILKNDEQKAKELAQKLSGIFGKDGFYLELMSHGIEEQEIVNKKLIQISKETGIPLIATNDSHYIYREDAQAQDVMMCIQTGRFLDETNRMKMQGNEFYLKSGKEMAALFETTPEAISNTMDIARRCNVELDFDAHHLPEFQLPEGEHDKLAYFKRLATEGLERRYGNEHEEAKKRLELELSVIANMGYVDYFLVVWDFIRYAKEKKIPVGPGRGSGAGSITAYALGITDVDPLKYGLLFERFLNPERISMPDFDIDFCYERRQEVIDYVIEKYGKDHVAQIITFGTMAARAAIRDVGRVMRIPYGDVDKIAKMVPFEIGMTLEQALKQNPELKRTYDTDVKIKEMIDTAIKLEGMPRHAGTHAAGVVISQSPLIDIVPLQKNDDTITTQFEMGAVEELGLLKMDFLGLRNLTVIADATKLIESQTGEKIDFSKMEMDDKEVYEMISRGDTDGVFQLESAGMRNLLRELKPTDFEDIIACVSLYRPGPMAQIPNYIKGKHQKGSETYLHEKLRPILGVTYGCMVYQEQVMQIVRELAGFSWARSDLIRRAMSKKDSDVMKKERQAFIFGDESENVPGAVKNGVPERVAHRIFDQMMDFAQYAFNKSHAAAYAVVAYRTAYLKAHYPVEYMAALMNSCLGNADRIAQYIGYCRKNNIEVLPPDVNYSGQRFEVDHGAIRFGLQAVKNVGSKAIEEMIATREDHLYEDFFDFVKRVPVDALNKRMVESMIKAGCFDSMGHKRAALMAVYEKVLDAESNAKRRNIEGQVSLFEAAGMQESVSSLSIELPDVEEYKDNIKLAMEKEMSGVYISGHPLLEYTKELEQLPYTIADILDSEEGTMGLDGKEITIAGIITKRRTQATKAGNLMAYITLEDMSGEINILVFPQKLDEYGYFLFTDQVVGLSGRVSIKEDEAATFILEKAAQIYPGGKELASLASNINGRSRNGNHYPAERPSNSVTNRVSGEELPTFSTEAPKKNEKTKEKTLWLRMKSFDNNFLMGGVLHTLMQYPGDCVVKALAVDSDKRMQLRTSIQMCDALIEEMKEIIGEENVVVVD